MGYTAEQMAAHGELHYRSAADALMRADNSTTPLAREINNQTAIAEALVGMLAMALAGYAAAPMTDEEF